MIHAGCRLYNVIALVLVVVVALTGGCNRSAAPPDAATPVLRSSPPAVAVPETRSGHELMLVLLEQIANNPPEEHLIYECAARTRQLRSALEQIEQSARDGVPQPGALERWQLYMGLGSAETRLGEVQSGIDHLLEAEALLSQLDFAAAEPSARPRMEQFYKTQTWFALGVSYMRLGEDQNCCLRHNAESCILPIQGGGLHTKQAGSRNAIKYFLKVLDQQVADPGLALNYQQGARWLLNIAYMTIGGFPDEVPEQHRVPSEVFRSELDFPRFENVAPKLGMNTENLNGGAIVDDFDNDGYLDIVTSTWDIQGQMRFFRNNQDGSFTERTEQAGLRGLYGGLNMVQSDYDDDGDIDIFVLRGAWFYEWGKHPNSLLRNEGDGTFTDVTFEAGLGADHFPTKTAAWGDYDNDGDVDLFVANETKDQMIAPCQLFRSNGDGTFTDVAAEAGVRELCFSMGTVWGDYNGDRYLDLYLAGSGPNRLFRNNRDGTFTDVASELAVIGPSRTFPVWFWDFDNDCALDLFVSCSSGPIGILALNPLGIDHAASDGDIRALQESVPVEVMHLYHNDGKGRFREVASEQNLTYPAQPMGANFGDLDNDGYLDFYLATGDIYLSELRPNVMFLNRGGSGFTNVTMAGGFGHLQKGHGVSFADIDNDGDQDVYIQMGGAFAVDKFKDALFENPGFGNHWITVDLIGRRSNRAGLGARIHARILEGGNERSIYRDVNSGGSFGCNPLRQTVGLGKADRLLKLEIFWPTSDRTQVFEDMQMDQVISVVEGRPDFRTIALRSYRLGGSDEPQRE